MKPIEHFAFCPSCGQRQSKVARDGSFACERCQFVYYFNPAIAAAALVFNSSREALFIRRAKDPAKGKLALPGGFIDAGETAEEALRREMREEVNLELGPVHFLASFPNVYHYKGVTYPVLDFFFVAEALSTDEAAALDGVESYEWLSPAQVPLDEIAFPSMRRALQQYLTGRNST